MRKALILDYVITLLGFSLSFYAIFDLRQIWAIIGFGVSCGDLVRVLLRERKN